MMELMELLVAPPGRLRGVSDYDIEALVATTSCLFALLPFILSIAPSLHFFLHTTVFAVVSTVASQQK